MEKEIMGCKILIYEP